jgi:hypothetical protein
VDTRNAPGYINEDFDYFNEKSPFNGTSGVGIGTRAQMNAITSCAEYTGFWVTDEGNWNTSNGATPDGRLYQCRSRAWVLAYTPYTYPHPLTLGPPPPPAPTACDVNRSGATTVHDIQLASNQVLRISACATGDINRDGNCTSVDVQRVVNAALGGLCITNP